MTVWLAAVALAAAPVVLVVQNAGGGDDPALLAALTRALKADGVIVNADQPAAETVRLTVTEGRAGTFRIVAAKGDREARRDVAMGQEAHLFERARSLALDAAALVGAVTRPRSDRSAVKEPRTSLKVPRVAPAQPRARATPTPPDSRDPPAPAPPASNPSPAPVSPPPALPPPPRAQAPPVSPAAVPIAAAPHASPVANVTPLRKAATDAAVHPRLGLQAGGAFVLLPGSFSPDRGAAFLDLRGDLQAWELQLRAVVVPWRQAFPGPAFNDPTVTEWSTSLALIGARALPWAFPVVHVAVGFDAGLQSTASSSPSVSTTSFSPGALVGADSRFSWGRFGLVTSITAAWHPVLPSSGGDEAFGPNQGGVFAFPTWMVLFAVGADVTLW